MNIIILLSFGLIYSFIVVLYNQKLNKYSSHNEYFMNKMIEIPFLIICFVFFIILSSFQYIDLSENAKWVRKNDLTRYAISFYQIHGLNIIDAFDKMGQEPLYVLLNYLVSKITSSFSVFLIICFSYINFCYYKFIKNMELTRVKSFIFLFFVFIYTIYLTSFCLLRMGLAVATGLLAIKPIKDKEWKKGSFITLLACGFHFSAVFIFFVILLYILFIKINNLKLFIIVFIFSFIIGLLFIRFIPSVLVLINGRYAFYKESSIAKNTYLTNILLIILILYKNKSFFASKNNVYHFVVLISSFYIMILQSVLGIFYRMIFFTYPSIVVILYELFRCYKVSKKEYLVPMSVKLFLIIYCLFYLYSFCTKSWYSYGLNEYKIFYIY